MRRAQRHAAIDVAFDLQPARFVGVEPVFVVDQRRRALGEDATRHHPVDRAPIIGQHQIEAPHVARQRLVARNRWPPGQRRWVLRDFVADALGDLRARAELVGHAADDRVPRRVAEGVHQTHGARFLAAQAEAGMQVENMDRLVHRAGLYPVRLADETTLPRRIAISAAAASAVRRSTATPTPPARGGSDGHRRSRPTAAAR